MKRTSFAGMNCSVARTLEAIGEWWTLLILRDAFLGVRRFEDFQSRLGIARNILTDRLQTLVEHEILERQQYHERPDRFEYRLTEKGLDLHPILFSLLRWGDRWTAGEEGPPLVLEHRSCGHEITPILVCPACREEVNARTMRVHPGPGAETSVLELPDAGFPPTRR
jgi:DNA-binding HxlR family transcriptional regulator